MNDIHYELAPDIQEMAEKLCALYGLHLAHVDTDQIAFLRKWGFKPKKGQIGEISTVKGYAKVVLQEYGQDFAFEFSVWAEPWEQQDKSIQELLLFHALYSISPKGGSKLRQPDVQEHGPICEYFGPYWRREKVVESLINDNSPLPLPLPPDDETTDDQTNDWESEY